MPKINIIGHLSSRMSLKKFSEKILLDNNMTGLLEKFLSKNVYNRGIIALSKVSSSSFSDCLYFYLAKIFNAVYLVLKAWNFNLSKNVQHDNNMFYLN